MKSKAFYWPDRTFWKKSLKIMVPLILGQMVFAAVTMIDNFMVSQTDDSENNLSAVAISGEVNFFVFECIGAISFVSSIFLAQYFGAGKIKQFKDLTSNALGISVLVAIVASTIVISTPRTFLGIFTGDDEVIDAAENYLRISMAGNLLISMTFPFFTTFNSMGRTKIMLFTSLIALINNALFDYILIYPADFGVDGAAVSTVFSLAIELVIVLVLASRMKEHVFFSFAIFNFNTKLLRQVMKKWFYMMAMIVSTLSMVLLTAIWSNYYGKEVTSAVGIGYAVLNIIWTIFPGIGAGTKVMVGHHLGLEEYDEALENSHRLVTVVMVLAFGFAAIAAAFAFFVPVVMDLKDNSEGNAQSMIWVYGVASLFYIFSAVHLASLDAGGITLPSTVFSNFYRMVVDLPVAWVLAATTDLDFWVVLAISQAMEIVPAIISQWFYHKKKWLKNVVEEEPVLLDA